MQTKQNLSKGIFDTLKHRIIRWSYPPGYRMTEEELCREFGVSRVPVREALRMLEENGLVDKAPYRGCTVKQPNLTEVHELYDVRLALELFVVDQLIRRGLPTAIGEQLATTWRALLHHEEPTVLEEITEIDGVHLAQLDVTFHETLTTATGNRTLLENLQLINERLYFTRMTDITSKERLQQTCQQHLYILECIVKGERSQAREAITANIEFGRGHVETALKEALVRAYLQQDLGAATIANL
ncbi:MAG: GntR family transcriptional regulator [Caldilineaceae bacterium]|nr:GntR family transcriptional regulator [Caldilineaceae bacterium]